MSALNFPDQTFTEQRRNNLTTRQFYSYFKATRRYFSDKRVSAGDKTIAKWSQELQTIEQFLAAEAQKQEEEEGIAVAEPATIDSG